MALPTSNTLNLQPTSTPSTWPIETALFNILTTYLPSPNTHTAPSTASEINALFPLHRTDDGEKEDPSSFLAEFWDLMFSLIQQIDYSSEPARRFIELIKALRGLSCTTTFVRGGDTGEVMLWRDLPGMVYQVGEVWNRFDMRTMTVHSEEFTKWKNLNGIIARMSNEGLINSAYFALARLALGLEQDIAWNNIITHRPTSGSTSKARPKASNFKIMQQLEIHLPIAVLWIEIGAAYLYGLCLERACGDEMGRETEVWKGRRGFSVERWVGWRRWLGEVRLVLEGEEEEEGEEGERGGLVGGAVMIMDALG